VARGRTPSKLLKRDVATHHGSHKLQQTLLRFRPQQLRVNRAAVLNPELRGHLQLHASHILATERAKRTVLRVAYITREARSFSRSGPPFGYFACLSVWFGCMIRLQ
jgi:hypothetical protein